MQSQEQSHLPNFFIGIGWHRYLLSVPSNGPNTKSVLRNRARLTLDNWDLHHWTSAIKTSTNTSMYTARFGVGRCMTRFLGGSRWLVCCANDVVAAVVVLWSPSCARMSMWCDR